MAHSTGKTLIPSLRYRDAHAAIDWLCRVFGFTCHAVYEGKAGGIDHAQLTHGNGMLMLGSIRDNAFSQHMVQPDEIGGRATGCIYVVVTDCRAHHDRAVAEGARILLPYEEKEYGGADYTCIDLEGYVWSFGSYDPWAGD